MPPTKLQTDSDMARVKVKVHHPAAIHRYISAYTAQVYDPATNTVLGEVTGEDHLVEKAWLDAEKKLVPQPSA